MAIALGSTVDELLGRLSSKELSEWMAFDSLEPIGEVRGDYRIALLTATLLNAQRKRGVAAFKPQEFMPFVECERPRTATPEKAYALLKALAQKR